MSDILLRPLSDLIELRYGRALPERERINGPFAVYGSNGIVGRHKEFLLDKETIVVGRKGSVGEVTLTEEHSWPIDTTYYVEMKCKNKLDMKYLYYFLKTLNLKSLNTSSAVPGLNRKYVLELGIPLPEIDKQKEIVTILQQMSDLTQKREKANQLTQRILRAVFLKIFGDPISNLKERNLLKLSQVGTVARGKSKHRPRNAPKLLGGKYPLIQTGDVANSGGYITKYSQTYSDAGLKQSKMWPKGTLCITIAANIAATGILTFDSCFPDSVVGFTPNEKVTTEYVQYWLSFLKSTLETTAPQVAQKNINLAILSNLLIPVPPIELQNNFSYIVASFEQLWKKQGKSTNELAHLSNFLMSNLFKGEFVA